MAINSKYYEGKETSEYEKIRNEYNNHYGCDICNLEHRCNGNVIEYLNHTNIVNDACNYKKR